ncbi:hypothetical protein [Hydrogenophaga defluvii]|uniref:Uncharacterized protein n=1 Tax=Hydrogenophaga defluvii TaxID=249410 RepID=A0ABW2SFM7_9BURK
MKASESTVLSHASGVHLVILKDGRGDEVFYVLVDHPIDGEAPKRTYVGKVGKTPLERINEAMERAQGIAVQYLREQERSGRIAG